MTTKRSVRRTSGTGSASGEPYSSWLATKRLLTSWLPAVNTCNLGPNPSMNMVRLRRVAVTEGAGVAVIPADRARTVPAMNVGEPLGDVGHRLVPPDGFEPVRRPFAAAEWSRGRDR